MSCAGDDPALGHWAHTSTTLFSLERKPHASHQYCSGTPGNGNIGFVSEQVSAKTSRESQPVKSEQHSSTSLTSASASCGIVSLLRFGAAIVILLGSDLPPGQLILSTQCSLPGPASPPSQDGTYLPLIHFPNEAVSRLVAFSSGPVLYSNGVSETMGLRTKSVSCVTVAVRVPATAFTRAAVRSRWETGILSVLLAWPTTPTTHPSDN